MEPRILIKTDRLVIRPFKSEDFPKFEAGLNGTGPAKNEYDFRAGQKATREEFDLLLNIEKPNICFQIFDLQEDQWLGSVDVYNVKGRPFQSATIDYILLNKFWGQGFVREAVKAVIHHLQSKMGIHRIEATVEIQNEKSLRVLDGLGFHYEGIRQHGVRLHGEWKDLKVYSLITKEITS